MSSPTSTTSSTSSSSSQPKRMLQCLYLFGHGWGQNMNTNIVFEVVNFDHKQEPKDIAGLCSRFVVHLFECPHKVHENFNGPYVELTDFIATALSWSGVDELVVFAALLLLQRLKSLHPGPTSRLKSGGGHRLFIASLILAHKSLCDEPYSNKAWCWGTNGMLSLWQINDFERKACAYLGWNLVFNYPFLLEFKSKVTKTFGNASLTSESLDPKKYSQWAAVEDNQKRILASTARDGKPLQDARPPHRETIIVYDIPSCLVSSGTTSTS